MFVGCTNYVPYHHYLAFRKRAMSVSEVVVPINDRLVTKIKIQVKIHNVYNMLVFGSLTIDFWNVARFLA